MTEEKRGRLYLSATPIGNLEDMTFRAVRILGEADLIAAEDTRHTRKLLSHYDIHTAATSYHEHNKLTKGPELVEKMQSGAVVVCVSDAGLPGISDPGFLLVRECVRSGVELSVLPGATAFVPALVGSGLPCERFCFEGFLPHKKGRQSKLEALKSEQRTMIFYESPHRIAKTLEQFKQTFGEERRASLAREISKKFEEFQRGTLSELSAHYAEKTPKGEFVIVVEGNSKE